MPRRSAVPLMIGILFLTPLEIVGQQPVVSRLGPMRFRHPAAICTLVFAADGKTLFAAGADGTIREWDVPSGKEVRKLAGHTEEVRGLAIAPGGKKLFSASLDREVRSWDLEGKADSAVRGKHDDCVEALALSPDGSTLATVGRDHRVGLWSATSGERRHWLAGHENSAVSAAFTPDGKTLATGSWDLTIRLWDVASGQYRRVLKGHTGHVEALAFAPDGKTLATGAKDGTIRLWNPATGMEVRKIVSGPVRTWALAFSRDGKVLLAGGEGPKATLFAFDPSDGKELWRRRADGTGWQSAPSDFITPIRGTACVVVSPDGKTFASAGADGRVRFWDPATGQERIPDVGHHDSITGTAFLPGGRTLVTASLDGTLRWWDVQTGKENQHDSGFPDGIASLSFSANGSRLAAAGMGTALGLWDAAGKKLGSWKSPSGPLRCLALSPDGKALASASSHEKKSLVILWNEEGRETRRLDGLEEDARALVFSPDGKQLAGVSRDEPIHRWETATGKPLPPLAERLRGVTRLAFSPDGRFLAAGFDGSRSVVLWDAATGAKTSEFTDEGSPIVSLLFSPDGQTIVAAHGDGGVRYWEVRTGKERRLVRPHSAPLTCLALSSDGGLLAVASMDHTAVLVNRWASADEGQKPFSAQRLQDLWRDLVSDQASRAYDAMCNLTAVRDDALRFLKPRLGPLPKLESKQIAKWIANLDARSFKAREEAMDNLGRLGRLVEDQLKETLDGKPTLELRRRVEELLKRMEGTEPVEEWRRVGRAVEVVERIGGPEAIAILEKLAEGGDFKPTFEARAALQRLRRR